MTKTKEFYNKLSEHIHQLPIAGYIKEEAIDALKYLHYYKLRNIDKNLKVFSEYLLFLNEQNTEKIAQLKKNNDKKETRTNLNLDYFLVNQEMNDKDKEFYTKQILKHGYELLTLTQGIKGLLILSIDEFCNASDTRIDIHQMLMAREKKKNLYSQ